MAIFHKYCCYTKHSGITTNLTLQNHWGYVTDVSKYHNVGKWSVRKHITPCTVVITSLLVRDKPLGAPPSVNQVYCKHIFMVPLRNLACKELSLWVNKHANIWPPLQMFTLHVGSFVKHFLRTQTWSYWLFENIRQCIRTKKNVVQLHNSPLFIECMLPWWPLLGLLLWYPIIKSSHWSLFEV